MCSHFDEGNPYDVVALMWTMFHCDHCQSIFGPDLQPVEGACCAYDYAQLGRAAKDAGWVVTSDLRCFCPGCNAVAHTLSLTAQSHETAP